MSSLLLIERTPLETRYARLADGKVVSLAFQPHVAPAALKPLTGDKYVGRVVARVAGGLVLDLGGGEEGFLRAPAKGLGIGVWVAAETVLPAFGAKRARLRRIEGAGAPSGPARRTERGLAAEALLKAVKAGDRIIATGAAEPGLGLPQEVVDPRTALLEAHGVEARIEAALLSDVALPGGGRLVIETAEALVAIDIDSEGASPAAVNLLAAVRIAEEIALRGLGGHILIDPAGNLGRRDLGALIDQLAQSAAQLGIAIERAGPTQGGLIELVLPRTRVSLAAGLTRAGATHRAIAPVLSDWAASARLARALLHRARPAAQLKVRLAPALDLWFSGEGAPARAALEGVTAARILWASDQRLAQDAFEIEEGSAT